jgi:hypothetical protein
MNRTALLIAFLLGCAGLRSTVANDVLGELQFRPAGKIERLAGVWIDGSYLGYVDELKGSKKVLLLPGEHQVVIRYAGYKDFTTRLVLEPGRKHEVSFQLARDDRILRPDTTSSMKIDVKPTRAAVFLNGGYVGHVDEFNGPGQWMLLPPGTYDVRITLPGYQPFETKVTLVPQQKFELKTDLFPGSVARTDPDLGQRSPQ